MPRRALRRVSPALAAVAALVALGAGAPSASAQQGGAEASGPAAGAQPPRPVVEGVTCRTRCAGIVRARRGSVVQVTGEGVERAAWLVFLGRRGRRDDVVAQARPIAPGAAQAVVPARARTGRLRVVMADRTRSSPSRRRILVGRARSVRGADLESRSDVRRVFVDGARHASVSFFARRSVPLAIDVVRAGDGAVVAHWDLPAPPAGTVQSVVWDGRVGGAQAPEGRYVWRVVPAGGDGRARAAQVAAPAGPSFMLLAHRFPVAGAHTYGDGIGAGRGHEGADVFAQCGTPVVAAIAGRVRHVAFHERAGHYLVVTGADGTDYAYMHLREAPAVGKGAQVATGQPLGAVGDTGRATGCHLHFEMWSAPGWYSGGALIDPMPHLRAWDVVA